MAINLGNRIMNTYVYPIRDGYIMIDTGYPNALNRLKRRLYDNGISLNDVKYIFLTHAHDDHCGCLKELMIKYPHIKVICHKNALPILKSGKPSMEGGATGFRALLIFKLTKLLGRKQSGFPKLDEFLLDRIIALDESNYFKANDILQGEVILTPGHTTDSISLFVKGTLYCGDLAMNGFPSRKRMAIWVTDRVRLESSWRKVIALKPDKVAPAHGKAFSYHDLEKYINYIGSIRIFQTK